MLTPSEQALISTAIDGELTAAQAASCRSLLAQNPAAALYFRQMRADARRLQSLPRATAPASLAAGVMSRVFALPRHLPASAQPSVQSSRWLKYSPFAVAATVLLAVSVGSLWFFSAGRSERAERVERFERDRDEARSSLLPDHKPLPPDRQDPLPSDFIIARTDEIAVLPAPRLVDESTTPRLEIAKATAELAPLPRPAAGDLVGYGIVVPSLPLKSIDLRLPLVVQTSDLDQPDVQERLGSELAIDPVYRLDVQVRNLQTAVDYFLAASRKAGATVGVDAATLERLTKKQSVTMVLYLEGLTPSEVATLLAQVGLSVKSSTPVAMTRANLFPAQIQEQRDVRDLFGIDLGLFRSSTRPNGTPSATSPGLSPGKSVSSDTIGQIATAMKKTIDKQGLLLTYLPPALRIAPSQSKEVKAFLERRGERKNGTIALMVVLRPSN